MKKLYLVDAYALIFKFYYALINRPMRNREGVNTSAIFGFTRFINDVITRERPQYLGVAFDPKGGNFRHKLYPEYKANRLATPEDIIASVPYIKRILEAMNIPILEIPGYEADDVIGTIVNKGACNGFEIYMITPDKDYGQLIRNCAYMYKPGKNGDGIEIVGLDRICEYYGIDDPLKIIDILALWGDASDNIPGVPGIGEKTAVKLVNEWGSVENIIANADKLPGKQHDNIIAYKDRLLLAKKLVTIDVDVPIAFEPEKLHLDPPDYDALKQVYIELGFNSLLKDLDYWFGNGRKNLSGNTPSDHPQKVSLVTGMVQGSLFADDEVSPKKSVTHRHSQRSDEPYRPSDGQPETDETPLDASDYKTVEHTRHTYRIVQDAEALDQLVGMLLMKKEVSFDTETTSLDPLLCELVGISFSVEPHKAFYVPCYPHERDKTDRVLKKLRPVFESGSIAKIGQNLKFDIMVLNAYGVEVNGFLYDTMIIHYLLESESRHGIDYLARKYLNYAPIPIEALIGKGTKQLSMDRVGLETAAEYAAEDADVALQLKQVLWKELEQVSSLVEVYKKIEEPLIRVLAEIEETGVKIDKKALDDSAEKLNAELKQLEEKIKTIAGEPRLNVNSSRQLGEVLFEKLKIDEKPKMTKTKQYRTDEEYLASLDHKHEVIGMILEYREIKKLLSTYVEALPLLINPKTGRIHTSFNQAVTATGRLSSNNPNLQNIPIRNERGREIRKAFVPADSHHLILSVDYSQVELRLMAHLSGDPALIEAFAHGQDIHAATAAKIFGVPISKVTDEQRRQAKTANFGIIYGISAFGLSQRLGITRTEARNLIDGYFASYPSVREYIDRTIAEAREKGYVTTVYGRRRLLPDIRSTNANVRSYAERNAINAPIQGSAADIIKLAMTEVSEKLKKGKYTAKLILQVHDELVLDVPEDEIEEVKDRKSVV